MEFIFEILLQLVLEVLAELGVRSLREPFRRPANPLIAALGYAMFGCFAGGLSLWIFPTLFMASHSAQVASLLITPFVAGAMMAALGAWRQRRDQRLVRLDSFLYGFVFAAAMAAVRFAFGS